MTHAFRADGWPLCPVCGEDELASMVLFDWAARGAPDPKPALTTCLAGEFRCYRCSWQPRYVIAPSGRVESAS